MLTPEQAFTLIEKEELSLIPNCPWMVEKDTRCGFISAIGQTPLEAINNWYEQARKEGWLE